MTDDQQRLELFLSELGPAAVAVSGGVDSMTLAVLAHRVNPAIEIFHAVSPAVPRQATERVHRYAESEHWRLTIIDAGEIEDPRYLANPANRCYFCKTNLYETIVEQTDSLVLSGTNTDDLSDYRPGLIAAKEHQVCHPYVECGISKGMLRNIARQLALNDLHDLPAAPCLSSRVETGIHISPKVLPIINDVEQEIRARFDNLRTVRCRIRSNGVVIEIDEAMELSKLQTEAIEQLVVHHFDHDEFPHLQTVRIEPYTQGGAFLVDRPGMQHAQNLAVDVTPD